MMEEKLKEVTGDTFEVLRLSCCPACSLGSCPSGLKFLWVDFFRRKHGYFLKFMLIVFEILIAS